MGETFDLFANDPLSVAARRSSAFMADFLGWLADNIHVYEQFEKRALLVAQRRSHYSGYTIFESMRFDSDIRENGGAFKLNNTRCADCCRLFALRNPAHAGLFEFRARKAA